MRPVSIGRQFGSMTYSFQGCADAPGPYNDIIYVEDINSLFENSTRGIFNPVDNTIRITYYTREIIDQFQLGSEYQEHVFVGTKL
jgi:hypothetical protein